MALPRGSSPVVNPPPVTPPGGSGGPVRAVVPAPGVYTPVWYAPNGEVLPLNPFDGGYHTTRGVSGLGLAPRENVTSDNPAGGVIVENARVRERTIIWPIRMQADTHMQFINDLFRPIGRLFAMTDTLGPGRLVITRPDGSQRQIFAVYASGFEQEAEDGAWLRGTAALNLLCPSPWWRDVDPTPYESREAVQPSYLSPYPSYGSGQVLGATEFANTGDREAWPSWTIRGPMTQMVATNVTRGETFTLTYPLQRGETITIESQPIKVRGPGGEQLVGALNLLTGGKLWRLDPRVPGVFTGTSKILFNVSGSDGETAPGADDGTLVRLQFTRLWETA